MAATESSLVKKILSGDDSIHEECINLGPVEGKVIAEALKQNPTLESFKIFNVRSPDFYETDDNDVEAVEEAFLLIAQALLNNTHLHTLQFADAMLFDLSATAIANLLKTNKTLVDLDLEFNSFRDEGAFSLADALMINNTLQSLNLHENSISDQGLIAIANALLKNESLETLNIRENAYTIEGLKEITKILKENFTLTELFFSIPYHSQRETDAPVMKQVTKEINSILKRNKRIQELLKSIKKELDSLVPFKKQDAKPKSFLLAPSLERQASSSWIQSQNPELTHLFSTCESIRKTILELTELGYPSHKILEIDHGLMLKFCKYDFTTLEPSFLIGQLEGIIRSADDMTFKKRALAELAHHHLKMANSMELASKELKDSKFRYQLKEHYLFAYVCGSQGEDTAHNQSTTALALSHWMDSETLLIGRDTLELEDIVRKEQLEKLSLAAPIVIEQCKHLSIDVPLIFQGVEEEIQMRSAHKAENGGKEGFKKNPISAVKVPLDSWDQYSVQSELKQRFDEIPDSTMDCIPNGVVLKPMILSEPLNLSKPLGLSVPANPSGSLSLSSSQSLGKKRKLAESPLDQGEGEAEIAAKETKNFIDSQEYEEFEKSRLSKKFR